MWTGEQIRRSTPAVGELVDSLGHLGLGADQRGGVDELVGDRLVGLLALAVEVKALDLVGNLTEAEAMSEVDIEVGLARAHAAEIEQEPGLDDGARGVEVAVDRDLKRRRDLEVLARTPALGEAGLEVLAPRLLEGIGGEEDRDPAVADLGRHLDRLAADRADEHGDLVANRVEVELQRLALAASVPAPSMRQLVVLALVLERALAGDDLAHDLDVLARPAPGLRRRGPRTSPPRPAAPKGRSRR